MKHKKRNLKFSRYEYGRADHVLASGSFRARRNKQTQELQKLEGGKWSKLNALYAGSFRVTPS